MDDRRSTTSIYMMATEAIRKAVTYHHTQIGPAEVDIQEDLRTAICSKIRDQPGGTLAIRTLNVLSTPSLSLKTLVAYSPPAQPGSRRAAREERTREAREARHRLCRARGEPTHTLSFFGYDTDVSDEEPSDVSGDAPQASRRRRVRRSLIRRLSYYPPRAPETRQIRLDFVNLEQGADFTPPLYGEEYEDNGGVSSGMDSDFDEEGEHLPARPATLAALASVLSATGVDRDFSPTTSTRHLVQGLSFATPPPILPPSLFLPPASAQQPVSDSVWGVGALGAATAPPDRDAAAAALWQATEAAWDAAAAAAAAAPPSVAPMQPDFVLHHAPGHILEEDEDFDPEYQRRIPHISDQERLGESAFTSGFLSPRAPLPPNPIALPPADPVAAAVAAAFDAAAAAAAATAVRPVTPPPTMPAVQSEQQLRLVSSICNAIITSGAFPPEIVAAYVADVAGARVYDARLVRGYADLRTPEQRAQFRQLHLALQCVFAATAAETAAPAVAPAAAAAAPAAATASAPATPAPSSSSSHRIDIVNIPGMGVRRIEQAGDLPATFTSRARMKRQREQRAASAAAIQEAHAAAAAHAARQSQQSQPGEPEDAAALVAGPSASFDHERRKQRRVLDETCVPSGSSAAASPAAAAEQQPQQLQRVLGAVLQQSAVDAAAAAAHHNGPCSCPLCPTSSHRLPPPSSSLPPSLFHAPIPHHAPVQQQQQLQQQLQQIFELGPSHAQQPDLEHITQLQRMRDLTTQHLLRQQELQRQQQAAQLQQTSIMRQLLQQHQLQQQQLQQQQLQQQTPPPAPAALSVFGDLLRIPIRSVTATTSAPSLGRLDPGMTLPFGYNSMSFLSGIVQPTVAPPSSFVDLPDANQVLSRQHMFTQSSHHQAAASLISAAASASSVQQQQRQETTQQHQDRIYAEIMHLGDLSHQQQQQQLQLLLNGVTAGMPTGGEAAPIGATQRDIEKYSTTHDWKATPGDADADPCTVCMSDFEENESVRVLPCHHSFHVRCIDRWLSYNKKCPNCRVDLDQQAADAAAAAAAAAPAAAPAAQPEYSAAAAADPLRTEIRAQAYRVAFSMGQPLDNPAPVFPSILGNIRMG